MNEQPQSLYEMLDIAPDASIDEIRAAYLRVKSAYSKDSLALYSLLDPADNKRYIEQAEEAYRVLSSPEKKRDYDRHHGLLLVAEEQEQDNIIRFDRVPPMEEGLGSEDLLIPPNTDNGAWAVRKETNVETAFEITADPVRPPPTEPYSRTGTVTAPASQETAQAAQESSTQTQINREILTETEFRGNFLRKVRESRQLSIEEIADFTKIKRQYIRAIEAEDFDQLPAPVFVRGFVIQFAKMLRLPHDRVSNAFMNRYHLAKKNKAS